MKKNGKKLDDNYEIVVAHYNEDLEWIKPYAKNAVIYHKGRDDFPIIMCKEWIKLDNVWREWETYLYHIIKNYDNLADVTIFLQWWIKDHLNDGFVYNNFDDYLCEAKNKWFSTKSVFFLKRKNPQIKWEWKFLESIENWSMKRSAFSFSSFYKEIFGKNQPFILPVFYAANFAVTKEKIHSNSVWFYKRIHGYLTWHSNPEEWHFVERLRFVVFNKKLSLYYLRKIIFSKTSIRRIVADFLLPEKFTSFLIKLKKYFKL